MKRTKKELEKILSTYIKFTMAGQIVIDVPLEALYHLQNFFQGPLPLDQYDVRTKLLKPRS